MMRKFAQTFSVTVQSMLMFRRTVHTSSWVTVLRVSPPEP